MKAINYSGDGISMTGYLADGSIGTNAPGILVAHEAMGVNDHIISRTQALADLGYVALALDLYGDANLPLDVATAGIRHAELMAAPGAIYRRAISALRILTEHPNVDEKRVAAIGFCQGGITALELARENAPIRCAIGFHPGLQRPIQSVEDQISAKILMIIGDEDPFVPPEDRVAFAQSMRKAEADWQLHIFGGVGHSFTNRDVDALKLSGIAYDADADRLSWAMMLSTLDEVFK